MEQTLGKARILRLYLAPRAVGHRPVRRAGCTHHYFGIRAQELDAGHAVWLAAMLHQPAAEAERWASTGHINLPRAQWVATILRPMPRRQRETLADQLSQVAWRARQATG